MNLKLSKPILSYGEVSAGTARYCCPVVDTHRTEVINGKKQSFLLFCAWGTTPDEAKTLAEQFVKFLEQPHNIEGI